jgi:hypothetical protein
MEKSDKCETDEINESSSNNSDINDSIEVFEKGHLKVSSKHLSKTNKNPSVLKDLSIKDQSSESKED